MLAQLVSQFQERAYLSVLQGSDTITILSHQSPRAVQAVGWVGRTTPAYCTSVGKALLFDHSRAELGLVFADVEFAALAPNTAKDVDELETMIESARAARLCHSRRGDGAGPGLRRSSRAGIPKAGSWRHSTCRHQSTGSRRVSTRSAQRWSRPPASWERRCAASGRPTWQKVAERAAQPASASTTAEHVLWEFATGLTWADVPAAVQRRLAWLTLDLATVSVAARELPSVAIAADYASSVHAGIEATALLDGRGLAAPGAAFANGVLANALDFDDGHRITKGHPGAIVIPAALAAAESRGASCEEFLAAVVDRLRGRDPARGSSCTGGRSNTTPRARGARSAPRSPARGCTGWTPTGSPTP